MLLAGDLAGLVIGGRYRLAERLGAGTFGVVWRASEEVAGRHIADVAVKICRPPDPDSLERVLREAQAMAQLHHDGLIGYRYCDVVGDGPLEGCFYLVMELADDSLAGRLRFGPLPADAVRDCVRSAARCLAHLHAHGAVHRDIKPSNLLVVGGRWKIGDLGLARALGASLATASALAGTPAYMAPEVFEGRVGPASDVHGLGVTAFEALTGRLPLTGGSPAELMRRILVEEVRIPTNLPAPWPDLLPRMLAKQHDRRPSAGDVAAALGDERVAPVANRPGRARVEEVGAAARGLGPPPSPPLALPGGAVTPGAAAARRYPGAAAPVSARALRVPSGPGARAARSEDTRAAWLRLATTASGVVVLIVVGLVVMLVRELRTAGPSQPPGARAAAHSPSVPRPSRALIDLTKAAVQLPAGSSWPEGAVVNGNDGSVLVPIPAGEAIFGSSGADRLAESDERPQFRARLTAYYIGVTEVTNAQYKRFADAVRRAVPDHWKGGRIPSRMENQPVVNVSWEDAQAYCDWAGLRLPTELEWEKAARGTDGRTYPWGNEWDASRCRSSETRGYTDTAAVGSFPSGRSPYGALDMAGNVWEWCADWYDSAAYTRHAKGDTTPPASGMYRVLRGGSWLYGADFCRSANRNSSVPSAGSRALGFRVAREM